MYWTKDELQLPHKKITENRHHTKPKRSNALCTGEDEKKKHMVTKKTKTKKHESQNPFGASDASFRVHDGRQNERRKTETKNRKIKEEQKVQKKFTDDDDASASSPESGKRQSTTTRHQMKRHPTCTIPASGRLSTSSNHYCMPKGKIWLFVSTDLHTVTFMWNHMTSLLWTTARSILLWKWRFIFSITPMRVWFLTKRFDSDAKTWLIMKAPQCSFVTI